MQARIHSMENQTSDASSFGTSPLSSDDYVGHLVTKFLQPWVGRSAVGISTKMLDRVEEALLHQRACRVKALLIPNPNPDHPYSNRVKT